MTGGFGIMWVTGGRFMMGSEGGWFTGAWFADERFTVG